MVWVLKKQNNEMFILSYFFQKFLSGTLSGCQSLGLSCSLVERHSVSPYLTPNCLQRLSAGHQTPQARNEL